jgi:hypothetical protein
MWLGPDQRGTPVLAGLHVILINWRWHDFGQVLINIDIKCLDYDYVAQVTDYP